MTITISSHLKLCLAAMFLLFLDYLDLNYSDIIVGEFLTILCCIT